jgi:alkylation response protein AidB-like acyl-CoA dehydrogenase
MGALSYRIDMKDIRFVLFDQFDIDADLKAITKYAEFDIDTYNSMLDEAEKMATQVLAPINGPGDRQGCSLDKAGNVTTPDGFKEAWAALAEGGWLAVNAEPELGGLGLPASINMAIVEMFSGAATAFQMYPGLTVAAARVVAKFGPEGKNTEVATKMFAGQWAGTMCLTEANAGSSVGDNRCKATPVDGQPGTYHLVGEKIFISGGDNDFTENIIHLVLARTPGAPNGTKGLSLFLVPKYNFDGSLNIGERNGAFVVGIEHKMGINGSATCTLALGADKPCNGYLLGKEFDGMALMFHMMNEARIGVGVQGVSLSASAYQYALAYAKDRVQGTSIANFKDADAPRVTINQHPDVRRMLMTIKCQTEAMRSFMIRLGHQLDVAEHTDDKKKAEDYMAEVELLVPVLKSHCSDLSFELAATALQVLGGFGYIGEYPVEQVVRDAKITSVYEGTNGIQAMDLLGRKLRMKGGALFMTWMQNSQKLCGKAAESGFEKEAEAINKSIQSVGGAAMHLGGLGMQGRLDGAMLQAVPFQRMLGTVQLAIESLHQAMVAKKLIDGGRDDEHLRGKLLNLKFYVANILPQAVALGKAVQSGDDSCLDPALFN